MNHEAILAVLPDSKDDAKSLKEIAQALGLEVSSYVDWIRIERRLSSSLRALTRWGCVGFGAKAEGRRPQVLVQCLLEN